MASHNGSRCILPVFWISCWPFYSIFDVFSNNKYLFHLTSFWSVTTWEKLHWRTYIFKIGTSLWYSGGVMNQIDQSFSANQPWVLGCLLICKSCAFAAQKKFMWMIIFELPKDRIAEIIGGKSSFWADFCKPIGVRYGNVPNLGKLSNKVPAF